jgi:pyruvate/2-oxoglutarate dehydrogenase complex dihydrolipoamide dehydrogenase (E3) component
LEAFKAFQALIGLFKIPMEQVLRARTLSETRGFLKALVEINGVGFSSFAVGGGEIMCSVQVAMIAGLPYTKLRDAVLTHPTLAEGLGTLFSSEPTSRNEQVRKVTP